MQGAFLLQDHSPALERRANIDNKPFAILNPSLNKTYLLFKRILNFSHLFLCSFDGQKNNIKNNIKFDIDHLF